MLSDSAETVTCPSLSKFPRVMVSSLLDAMRSGSSEARLLFPRLLQIVALFPDTTDEFIHCVCSIGLWYTRCKTSVIFYYYCPFPCYDSAVCESQPSRLLTITSLTVRQSSSEVCWCADCPTVMFVVIFKLKSSFQYTQYIDHVETLVNKVTCFWRENFRE